MEEIKTVGDLLAVAKKEIAEDRAALILPLLKEFLLELDEAKLVVAELEEAYEELIKTKVEDIDLEEYYDFDDLEDLEY